MTKQPNRLVSADLEIVVHTFYDNGTRQTKFQLKLEKDLKANGPFDVDVLIDSIGTVVDLSGKFAVVGIDDNHSG